MESDRARQQGAPSTSRSAGKISTGAYLGIWAVAVRQHETLLGTTGPDLDREQNKSVQGSQQHSAESNVLPETWGYFLLRVMNLISPLPPPLFTLSIATHWYTHKLYSSVVTNFLMGDLEIEIQHFQLRQFIFRGENSGLRGTIKSPWHKKCMLNLGP